MVAVFALVNLTLEMAIPRDYYCVDCSRSRGFFQYDSTSAIFRLKTTKVPWPGCSHSTCTIKNVSKTFQLKNVKMCVCVCVKSGRFAIERCVNSSFKSHPTDVTRVFPHHFDVWRYKSSLSLSSVGHVQKGMNDEWGF